MQSGAKRVIMAGRDLHHLTKVFRCWARRWSPRGPGSGSSGCRASSRRSACSRPPPARSRAASRPAAAASRSGSRSAAPRPSPRRATARATEKEKRRIGLGYQRAGAAPLPRLTRAPGTRVTGMFARPLLAFHCFQREPLGTVRGFEKPLLRRSSPEMIVGAEFRIRGAFYDFVARKVTQANKI